MQDVKTKREARRRRILENSEKRLQKITLLKYEEDEIIPEHLLTVSSTKGMHSFDFLSYLTAFILIIRINFSHQ